MNGKDNPYKVKLIMSLFPGGFVHAHIDHLRMVLFGPRLFDVVLKHPPQPGVVLFDQTGDRVDRHVTGQDHDEGLKQQRESAAFPRPGNLHHTHAADRTIGRGTRA